MKKILIGTLLAVTLIGCGGENKKVENKLTADKINSMSVEQILEEAKKEGRVDSVGMPDGWANWKQTWEDLKVKYGIEHADTDLSSAQEIAKFEMEKENSSADIGDIGVGFTPVAVEKNVTLPYKTSYWDEIPDWAKDKDGHWVLGYTGTIAFIVDKTQVAKEDMPRTWKDLRNGKYIVNTGDVGIAAQANSAILAAALALGGNEKNLEPAFELFADIAKQGRLGLLGPGIQTLEKGEIQVGLVWDFNGLNYRDRVDKDRFEVYIPEDGSLISGYATIINKYSKHLFAAMFTREYILSDEGQLNLAKGYAKPIRNIELPEEVKAQLLPNEQYKNAKPVVDHEAWNETSKNLASEWQEKVLVHVK